MIVRVSIYRNNVKRVVGWVIISHCYKSPLLHNKGTQVLAVGNVS